jgi:hypothetical protein
VTCASAERLSFAISFASLRSACFEVGDVGLTPDRGALGRARGRIEYEDGKAKD